jgi:hypothetical protein
VTYWLGNRPDLIKRTSAKAKMIIAVSAQEPAMAIKRFLSSSDNSAPASGGSTQRRRKVEQKS